MKIAVCDDEKVIRKQIAERIQRMYPDCKILEYTCGEQLLEDTEQPDIIFLDIQMEGIDGMETARRIRNSNRQTVLIFLTAWEEYVFQAFDVGAFHYLVKPFRKEKFYQVLEAAVKKARENKVSPEEKKEEKNIIVKVGAITRKINTNEIIYAEVRNRKVTLHTTQGSLEFYGKLSDLAQELGEDFVRPHRSYVINLRYVLRYCATDITMEDGTVILMAKQKYREFVKKYLHYIKRTEEKQ